MQIHANCGGLHFYFYCGIRKASPFGGKLSPQVTDEGENCGCCKTPRRGGVTPSYIVLNKTVPLSGTPYLNSQLSTLHSP